MAIQRGRLVGEEGGGSIGGGGKGRRGGGGVYLTRKLEDRPREE